MESFDFAQLFRDFSFGWLNPYLCNHEATSGPGALVPLLETNPSVCIPFCKLVEPYPQQPRAARLPKSPWAPPNPQLKNRVWFRYINTFYTSGSFASCISFSLSSTHKEVVSKPSSYSPFSNSATSLSLTRAGHDFILLFLPDSCHNSVCLGQHVLCHLQPTQLTEVPGWGIHNSLLSKVKMPKQQNVCKLS